MILEKYTFAHLTNITENELVYAFARDCMIVNQLVYAFVHVTNIVNAIPVTAGLTNMVVESSIQCA